MVTIRNIKRGKSCGILEFLVLLADVRRSSLPTPIACSWVEAPARISGDNLQSGADCILIAEDDDGNLTDRSGIEIWNNRMETFAHLRRRYRTATGIGIW